METKKVLRFTAVAMLLLWGILWVASDQYWNYWEMTGKTYELHPQWLKIFVGGVGSMILNIGLLWGALVLFFISIFIKRKNKITT